MDEDADSVEVELPGELLRDIDEYAARHGYESPGAVVRAALDDAEEDGNDRRRGRREDGRERARGERDRGEG
jgi:Arc/MetJ-type ribon-helix-helix transcriptional regulator